MPEPLLIEIIAHAPVVFQQCRNCQLAWEATGVMGRVHDEQIAGSLPADLLQAYQAVSDWGRDLTRQHPSVEIRVIDAASLEGILVSLRHHVHRHPAVIIGRQVRFIGSTSDVLAAASQEVGRRCVRRPVATDAPGGVADGKGGG